MDGLQQRVHEAIAKARERQADPNDRFTGTQELIAALVAWNQGIEDALDEIALEVEKLAAASNRKAATDNNEVRHDASRR